MATPADFEAALAGRTFTHVVHLADIHLRAGNEDGARYAEYDAVVDGLEAALAALPCIQHGTALIAVCGDIFHNKRRVEALTIRLWTRLLAVLARAAPTVLIAGNHDVVQEDAGVPDLVDVHVERWGRGALAGDAMQPVLYLATDVPVRAGNLFLATVPIQATLRAGDTRAVVAAPPAFAAPPPAGTPGIDATIALFHGTIGASRLPNGRSAAGLAATYALESFDGYDLLLLGDNHRQQVQGRWGYPGSLVQQNFGESLLGHGFLLWDVRARTATMHHVANDLARVRLSLDRDDGTVLVHHVDEATPGPLPLAAAVARFAAGGIPFPSCPLVEFDGPTEGEDAIVAALHAAVGAVPRGYTRRRAASAAAALGDLNRDVALTGSRIASIADATKPDTWDAYVEQHDPALAARARARGWFHGMTEALEANSTGLLLPPRLPPPQRALLSCLHGDLEDRRKHKELRDAAAKLQAALHRPAATARRLPVRLRHMSWSWLFGYGADNHYDFDTVDGEVGIVNGPNAIGKSAFLDIVCVALFGRTGSNRTGGEAGVAQTPDDYVNVRCPPDAPAGVALWFSIEETTASAANAIDYLLVRTVPRRAARTVGARIGGTRTSGDVTIVQLDAEGHAQPVASRNAVSDWINAHVGTLGGLMRTGLLAQMDRDNFFTAPVKDQVELVDEALDLDALSGWSELLHQSCNANKYLRERAERELALLERELHDAGGPLQGGRGVMDAMDTDADNSAAADAKTEAEVGGGQLQQQLAAADAELSRLQREQGRLQTELLVAADRNLVAAPSRNAPDTEAARAAATAALNWRTPLPTDLHRLELMLNELERRLASVGGAARARARKDSDGKLKDAKQALMAELDEHDDVAGAPVLDLAPLMEVVSAACTGAALPALAGAADVPTRLKAVRTTVTKATKELETLLDCAELHANWKKALARRDVLVRLEGQLLLIEGVREQAAAQQERARQRSRLQDKVDEIETVLEARQLKQQVDAATAYAAALATALQQEHGRVNKRIDEVVRTRDELRGRQLAHAEHFAPLARRRQLTQQVAACRELLAEWQAIERDCEALRGLFGAPTMRRGPAGATHDGTYKCWVYQNLVLPHVEAEVNDFLATLQVGMRFRIEYVNSKFKMSVSAGEAGSDDEWLAVSSASGYQQFVLGLAMRRALAALGRTGTRLSHLFLDEGFTACDRTNLQRAGEVLRLLMSKKLYSSIIVVSHLEMIRDEVDRLFQATIQRRPADAGAHAALWYGVPRAVPHHSPVPMAVAAATAQRAATPARRGSRGRSRGRGAAVLAPPSQPAAHVEPLTVRAQGQRRGRDEAGLSLPLPAARRTTPGDQREIVVIEDDD